MSIDQESFNKQLYDLLKVRGYRPTPKNNQNQRVNTPQEAHVFEFTFKKDDQEYGTAWATIDDAQAVTVYYDSEQADSPSGQTPGVAFDDSWTGFLEHLKSWAQRKQLDFELSNKDRLGDDMRQREYWKMKQRTDEAYYPMGKQASYNDAIPTVKIVLQHTRQIQEGEQRFRNVARIFLENQDGERFLAPTTRPGIAQVYARHLAEGGVPNDDRWNHIKSLCEEYNKMAGFVRATRKGEFTESAQLLVNEGINHYQKLRETLGKMRSSRGYNTYFESWTPALMEEEGDESLSGMFVEETLDPRIESVMPILSRLRKNISEEDQVNEVSILENWADSIVEGQEPGQRVIDKLEKIVDEHQMMSVPFTDGNMKVDAFTASAILQVYDAISDENKEKIAKMISSKAGFTRLADFAFERAKVSEDSVDEGLDANQKRAGQLGPTEKVGSKGAVGKLVGESTNYDQMDDKELIQLYHYTLEELENAEYGSVLYDFADSDLQYILHLLDKRGIKVGSKGTDENDVSEGTQQPITESVKNFTGSRAEPTESFDWLPPAAGSVRTISSHRKYKPGDQVEYAGGISTVVKQDEHGNVTLSNPKWYKDRVVRWHALEKPKPMKKSESITESVKNFTDAGIPRDFAEKLVSNFRVKHDAKLKPVEGKPRKADIEGGDMLINVLPSGEVIAVMISSGSRREYKYLRLRYTPEGELQEKLTDNIGEATSGMTKRGPMFMLRHHGIVGGRYRDDKPTPDEIERRKTSGDTLSGSVADIFSYMNKTFLPRLKPKMEKMVDEIFSNLRKLPKDVDKYGSRLSSYSRDQRTEALAAAGAIEDIMEKGFTRDTLNAFLRLQGVKEISRSQWGNPWEEAMSALRDFSKTDPLARAKWAKTILDGAKHYRNTVRDMLAQPVMKELTREEEINESRKGFPKYFSATNKSGALKAQQKYGGTLVKKDVPHPKKPFSGEKSAVYILFTDEDTEELDRIKHLSGYNIIDK